jgi:transcriptional/translational regulatory protein YebC/TACO1
MRCAFENFGQLQAAIEKKKLEPISAGFEYIAKDHTQLPEEQALEVLELVDALEQDDDVQRVFHNLT